MARHFGAPVILDPWQGVLMGQRLAARRARVEEYPFTNENRRQLFGVLLDLIRTGRIRCRPHEALRRELLSLETTETAAGWRVDHRVGRHDDHVIAVGLGCSAVTAEETHQRPAVARMLPSGAYPWSYGRRGVMAL